jgi:RNA polymerase sigma-70 factor (sigma-E family)
MANRRDEAFRTFVTERRAALVRTATLLTSGDAHLAEDLVQVALTRLYLAWPRLREEDGANAYANRILINAFIDETRRPGRRRERAHAVVPDTQPTTAAEPEDREAVLAALRDIPPRMRAAVVLRHWLGFDVADTASLLRCSEGTVKSQTARGLERLRDRLAAPSHDPAEA